MTIFSLKSEKFSYFIIKTNILLLNLSQTIEAMRRIFFEKDNQKDYLFVILDHEKELDQIYKVDNFTDESGREYVYNLIGERKKLNAENLIQHVVPLVNGKFKNFNEVGELESAQACIESIIDNRELNREQEIFIYVRNK